MTLTGLSTRAATRDAIRAVLAADCAAPEAAFLDDGLYVTRAEDRPGRRRYPTPARPLSVVTMGRGVVVSCYQPWTTTLRAMLGNRDRDEIFAAPTIAELSRFVARQGGAFFGPALSFACCLESFQLPADPPGIEIAVAEGEAVFALYEIPGFSHALSYDPSHSRPDVAAAVARRDGAIVGIAGMSADCESLWQIGIDVVACERGAGLGRALVSRMTTLAFQHGVVPSYTADIANLRSQGLATSLGYWPAWVECFVRAGTPA